MIRAVRTQVSEHGLICRGDHVLAAVSGGADSVCMLHVLAVLSRSMGFALTVAHLDHGIRGKASAADARFVKGLCRKVGVACVVGKADVPRRAARDGVSLEMAARAARYEFLARVAAKVGAAAVATAHTADDQAETLLLNLARGTARAGLGGIPRDAEVAGVRVIRPLLTVTRDAIEAFLKQRGLKWCEDETNRELCFLRNRVRHEVLPLLESRLNPSVRGNLLRTADVVGEEDRWLDQLASDALAAAAAADNRLTVKACRAMPVALLRRVLRLWLMQEGVATETLGYEMLCRAERLVGEGTQGSRLVDLSGGLVLKRTYGKLAVAARKATTTALPFKARVALRGETLVPVGGIRVEAMVAPGVKRPPRSRAGTLPAEASISRAAVGRRHLVVRSWAAGDRIRPLGMKGSRKLQDIFVDAKVPQDLRVRVPVFVCGGEVVWVPGYRVARGWEVKGDEPAVQLRVSWL